MHWLPSNIPIDKLDGIFRKAFEAKSEELISRIHMFIQKPLEASVESAEFRIFVPQFPDEEGLNIWLYLDGKNKLVGSKKQGLYAGNSIEFYNDFNDVPSLEDEAFKDYEYPDKISDIMFTWFSECWWKGGGWYYPVPTTLIYSTPFGDYVKKPITNEKLS